MFISNNRNRFTCGETENLVKHRKVSKYYETDYRCRNEHKYSKYKKHLTMIMLIRIKQHLSNIRSSIHEKVKQH